MKNSPLSRKNPGASGGAQFGVANACDYLLAAGCRLEARSQGGFHPRRSH